jgi:hypothetical protein
VAVNFIPEVWVASILVNFHNQAVLVGKANREYEGDLATGNTAHVPGIVDIDVKDYKTGVVLDSDGNPIPRTTAPDAVSDTSIDIFVDQEKSFDFFVDDIDRVQAGHGFDAYTQSAALGLVEDAETFLTAKLLTEGTAATGLTAPTDWASAYAIVLGLRKRLNTAKVPMAQRTLAINPAFEELILSDGSKITAFDKTNTTDGLREATIGRLLGFDVVVDPWLPGTNPVAVGYFDPALAYVSQINKIENMRGQDKFADRVRGLHVYGGKITRPTAVQVYQA